MKKATTRRRTKTPTTGRPRLTRGTKQLRGTLRQHRERSAAKAAPKRKRPVPTRDYVDIADTYVADVIAGRIVACGWVIKACQRFQRMRERAASKDEAFYFSPTHAVDVCAFFERLPHVEGHWSKANTIELQPFQVFILVACYGFRRRADRRKLVTNIFFQVSRKSAKSTVVAGAALYHLAVEREPGAQVICGGTTGQNARVVFGIMQRMVRSSAWLRELGLRAFANSITFEACGGNARPINSKSSSQDGLNPSFISLDESHAQSFELRDVLVSAMGARPDAAIWCPTTAGYDLLSVGFALRSTAMKLLDGVIESDHTFAVLYELDEQDDWRDAKAWQKAAPMIGITPSIEWVQRYCADSQQTPGMEGEFQTKVCGRWLHAANRWLSVSAWDKCEDRTLRLDDFAGARCCIGVDLAERDDIAGIALAFLRNGLLSVFVKGYLPELVVNERSRGVPEYRRWVQTGELVTTPGNMTDYPTIEHELRELCKRFDVQTVVVERYGALNMVANLVAGGLPAIIESKNAKVFTAPAKELEARIRAGKIRHTGSSFLRWQISNCCVERRRDGSLLPTKESAESQNKIDCVDAILLALTALLAQPEQTVSREPFMAVYQPRW
jgi:phage terminase large subunit-like protein